MCETQICGQPRRTDVHSVVLRLSPRPLVMKVRWVVKQTNPLTHRSSLDAGRQTPLATTDPGIGPDTSLADGSEAVSPTLGQRRQEQGVKNAVLLPPPTSSSDPLLRLTEAAQTPTMHPAILPGPQAPPDRSGIQVRGRLLLLSGPGLPVFTVWLHCPPVAAFLILTHTQGQRSPWSTSHFDGKWSANS